MRVVVAGGGIAALEVLAGLGALAGERVDVTLLAPDRSFSYRPLSTAVPFTFRDERTRTLEELADGLGAQLRSRRACASRRVTESRADPRWRLPAL